MSSHRGSYRGRNRGGSWRRGSNFRSSVDLPPPKPLGPTIDSINIRTLLTEEDAPRIKDVEYVASYNWVSGESPIILVPGSPPAWSPPVTDSKLKPDTGDVFRDLNAARYSSYPLEPTFRSLRVMQPDYDLQSVDIVGCGSTIGNLLRFSRSEPRPFRFDVDVIGDIVLFVRKENSPTELIEGIQGYGHTFPEVYTTWDSEVRDSISHQRIIGYEFGGLKLLVRTETDGYITGSDGEAPSAPSSAPDSARQVSLGDALESMALSNTTGSQDQKLQLKMQGTRIKQNQIFDIKTRASYKPSDMEEIIPRLWLNQTPNFLIAYHQFGLFDKPTVKNVRQDVIQWESDNSAMLARFHALIKRIADVVLDADQPQCEVSWDGKGNLCISKRVNGERRALPPDLVELLEAE